MKEAEIRKKAIKELTDEGWTIWYPYKSRFKKENDIFGVFDLILVQLSTVKFIQLTTKGNMKARERKVRNFLTKNLLQLNVEIWGWSKQRKCFFKLII